MNEPLTANEVATPSVEPRRPLVRIIVDRKEHISCTRDMPAGVTASVFAAEEWEAEAATWPAGTLIRVEVYLATGPGARPSAICVRKTDRDGRDY